MRCPHCYQQNTPNTALHCLKCGQPVYFMAGHDYIGLIVDSTRDFTGRDWGFTKIDAWLANSNGACIFFLSGGPDSGKSAVAMYRLMPVSI